MTTGNKAIDDAIDTLVYEASEGGDCKIDRARLDALIAGVVKDAELPANLLNVHAIADERDRLRDRLFVADELIRDAPLHHYGKDYKGWTTRRERYFAAREQGEP